MPEFHNILAFALIELSMALVPGPNMIYLVSRSITQGRIAGLISLSGVALGFVFYMICATFGLTALFMAVPYAYDTVRIAGAMYLLWLAWQAIRPGGKSSFQVSGLPKETPKKLFMMGLLTNLLNPKVAIIYLSLLPQFITPEHGNILTQSLVLGMTQITVGVLINAIIVISAGTIAQFLKIKPSFSRIQRWIMGCILTAFAIKILSESRR
ncbi:LysE family translocator (plasmid) [Salmonella enterica subsp. enterica serovar Strathcona]|uniref:LysE family translocator n=1 Tax=Salmonella enterica TaxID=28901 RepID=UPI0039BEE407